MKAAVYTDNRSRWTKFAQILRWQLRDVKYWVLNRTTRRYHILDLSNKHYDVGWIDADTQILYASFKILTLFVEQELPHDNTDWNATEHQQQALLEIKALHRWWTQEYNEDDIDAFAGDEYERENDMLRRLIAVRQYMWT